MEQVAPSVPMPDVASETRLSKRSLFFASRRGLALPDARIEAALADDADTVAKSQYNVSQRHKPSAWLLTNGLKTCNINLETRLEILEWLLKACDIMCFENNIFFDTALVQDRYYASPPLADLKARPAHHIALAAVLIAHKTGSARLPTKLREVINHLGRGGVAFDDVARAECVMLEKLKFRVGTPTALDFLDALSVRLSHQHPGQTFPCWSSIANFLLRLTLMDVPLHYGHHHAILAAAALALALNTTRADPSTYTVLMEDLAVHLPEHVVHFGMLTQCCKAIHTLWTREASATRPGAYWLALCAWFRPRGFGIIMPPPPPLHDFPLMRIDKFGNLYDEDHASASRWPSSENADTRIDADQVAAEIEIATALYNYELFYALPVGSATLDHVRHSSAGLKGWAAALINGWTNLGGSSSLAEERRNAEAIHPELDKAISALQGSLNCSGMSSEWTSSLASALEGPSSSSAKLRDVLVRHGWTGTQFSGPPHRLQLLTDLQSAKDDVAHSLKARSSEVAKDARANGITAEDRGQVPLKPKEWQPTSPHGMPVRVGSSVRFGGSEQMRIELEILDGERGTVLSDNGDGSFKVLFVTSGKSVNVSTYNLWCISEAPVCVGGFVRIVGSEQLRIELKIQEGELGTVLSDNGDDSFEVLFCASGYCATISRCNLRWVNSTSPMTHISPATDAADSSGVPSVNDVTFEQEASKLVTSHGVSTATHGDDALTVEGEPSEMPDEAYTTGAPSEPDDHATWMLKGSMGFSVVSEAIVKQEEQAEEEAGGSEDEEEDWEICEEHIGTLIKQDEEETTGLCDVCVEQRVIVVDLDRSSEPLMAKSQQVRQVQQVDPRVKALMNTLSGARTPWLVVEQPELQPLTSKPDSALASAVVLVASLVWVGVEAVEDTSERGDVSHECAVLLANSRARQAYCIGRVILTVSDDAPTCIPACAKAVVMNNGDVSWPEQAAVVIVAGEALGIPRIALSPVKQDEITEIEMNLQIPKRSEPGTARSTWAVLDTATDRPFGPLILLDIVWTAT